MNKEGSTYRLTILIMLIVAVCLCIIMTVKLKSNQEKIVQLESRIGGYQNSEKELNGFNVALPESEPYGDYQGNDDFSKIIANNPIDQDYKKELEQLQQSNDTTTLTWGAFEGKYLTAWKKEMDAALKGLYQSLDEEDRGQLEQSQKSWQTYIDDDHAFVENKFLLTRTFGTQGDMQFTAAQSRRTRERTIKLMEYRFSIDRESVDFVYGN